MTAGRPPFYRDTTFWAAFLGAFVASAVYVSLTAEYTHVGQLAVAIGAALVAGFGWKVSPLPNRL